MGVLWLIGSTIVIIIIIIIIIALLAVGGFCRLVRPCGPLWQGATAGSGVIIITLPIGVLPLVRPRGGLGVSDYRRRIPGYALLMSLQFQRWACFITSLALPGGCHGSAIKDVQFERCSGC